MKVAFSAILVLISRWREVPASIPTYPLLTKQHRTRSIDRDQHGNQEHQRRQDEERQSGHTHIDDISDALSPHTR